MGGSRWMIDDRWVDDVMQNSTVRSSSCTLGAHGPAPTSLVDVTFYLQIHYYFASSIHPIVNPLVYSDPPCCQWMPYSVDELGAGNQHGDM